VPQGSIVQGVAPAEIGGAIPGIWSIQGGTSRHERFSAMLL
jgi:hypothetical protein